MTEQPMSNRQIFPCSHRCPGPKRLGIYKNSGTGNLFYSTADYGTVTNRVIPSKVWLDDDGYVCVQITQLETLREKVDERSDEICPRLQEVQAAWRFRGV